MNDVRRWLRDADPVAEEPALCVEDVQRIRRLVVSEVGRPRPAWWPPPLVVAATVAATLTTGVIVGQQVLRERPARRQTETVGDWPSRVESPRRQVQFATPGGTRIVWVIDPDFDL
jgi:hypothetical protein